MAAGLISRANGLVVLSLAGTSPNYRGIVASVQSAQPLETALLDELEVDFRERVDLPPFAEAMVTIEHTHDQLQALAAAGWRAPAEHPDLDPAHEALLLREHFTELLRFESVQQQPEALRQQLRESEAAAQELEVALRQWMHKASKDEPPQQLSVLAERINTNCKSCHQNFRDIPLKEN